MHISSHEKIGLGATHLIQLNEVLFNISKYLQPIKVSQFTKQCEGILVSPLHLVPLDV